MDFGIGAVTVHDEIPNKSCSVILRELYNIIHASFEWTATSNTIPKIRRDAIALQAEMDRPLCAFFFFFKCLDALSFLFTYFFSFRSPFRSPIILQMHLPLPAMDLNISHILQP